IGVTGVQTCALPILIPADERDGGASAVRAGESLAEQIAAAHGSTVYDDGLPAVAELALARFRKPVAALDPTQVHDLLAILRESQPAFFHQLKSDVCTLYLSDPG